MNQNDTGPDRGNIDSARSSAVKMFDVAAELTAAGRNDTAVDVLRTIHAVPGSDLDRQTRILLMLNERSRFRYRSALNAIAPLIKGGGDQSLENKARLLNVLIDVPPEKVELSADVKLPAFRFTATVGRARLSSLIDTGAGFSAISRSAARHAGLRVRAANYRIETAFGQTTQADVAVGDIQFSSVRIRNVVFFVLSDGAFGNGSPLSMVIGIPVLRLLALTIGGGLQRSERTDVRMRFRNGSPVVETMIQGARQECELDTGSDRSSIAAARLPVRAFALTPRREKEVSVMSATGKARWLHGSELPVRIALGNRAIVLPRIFAMASERGSARRSACSLGRDVLHRLEPLALDFRSMRLVLQ